MSEQNQKTLIRLARAVVVIGTAVFIIGLAGGARTPTYKGGGVEKWFLLLNSASEVEQQDAEEAVDALGRVCFPFLLSQVQAGKPRLGDRVKSWFKEKVLHRVQIGECGLMDASEAGMRLQRLQKAFEILGDRAASVAPRLRVLLRDPLCSYEAGVSLIGMGELGLKQLEDAFENEKTDVRQVVANVLADATLSRGSAACLALNAMKDQDGLVRHYAAYALGQLVQRPDESVRALAGALEDTDPRVRYISVYALKAFGIAAQPAIPAIRNAERDPEENVRKGAAEVLSKLENVTLINDH
jgi:HEAT repeat protein